MTRTTPYAEFRAELLADPEVKAAFDAMENEFALARSLISARAEAKLSQQDVADRMKTTQSAVARMESGRHAPSMTSIVKYATAVGRTIRFEIHPERTAGEERQPLPG